MHSSVMNGHSLPQIAETILTQIEVNLKAEGNKHLSDKDLLSLHSIFGSVLQRALEIFEKHTLIAYHTPGKQRTLIEVNGDNGRCYRVFPRLNFCPCLAFKHQVVEQRVQITCKHVIAARLALILDKLTYDEVTQDQYLMLLKSLFNLDEGKPV